MELRFRPKQSKVLRYLRDRRFVVLVAGRRFGKTYLAITALIDMATRKKRAKCWYVAPTYKQAKEISWDVLKESLPRHWIRGKPNESELTVTLRNGSRISLKGADNADSLRGPGLDILVIDEAADVKNLKNVWEAVIGPTLTTTQGHALFIGTPKGYDYFYDLYCKGISIGLQDSHLWAGFQWTSAEGGYIPAEELELKRREIDPRIYRQEYEASFETLTGRVYYQFDRNQNIVPDLQDVGGDILVGIDFNVDPMSAVVGVRAGRQLHVLDEIEIPNSNTQELADELSHRYGQAVENDPNFQLLKDLGKEHEIPTRKIRAFPDPSGRARKTSANLGVTDLVILRRSGFDVVAPRKAPGVMDRLNTVNAMLCNAAGERNLLIHPRCTRLAKCLDGLTYKEGTNQPNKGLGLDHLPDALGYLVWSEFPILQPGSRSGEIAA